MFFGGRTPRRRGPQKGADLRYDLEITLEEAASGLNPELTVPGFEACDTCQGSGVKPGTQHTGCPRCNGTGELRITKSVGYMHFTEIETCKACQGKGIRIENLCKDCNGVGSVEKPSRIKLKISPGVDNGYSLRLSGRGKPGLLGGPNGDLYVVLHVKPHKLFKRDGSNLYFEAHINFTQAALGTKIFLPTLDGKARLKIPSGTQSETLFRLKRKGVPRLSGWGSGDLFVKVIVRTPKKLTRNQKKLMEELDKELNKEVIFK
jgi:molecular chaperone DnaJ